MLLLSIKRARKITLSAGADHVRLGDDGARRELLPALGELFEKAYEQHKGTRMDANLLEKEEAGNADLP
jgi:hypothetical protein